MVKEEATLQLVKAWFGLEKASWLSVCGLVLTATGSTGCAPVAHPSVTIERPVAAVPAAASAPQARPQLPPARPEEAQLADELRESVTALVAAGERNTEHEWNLAVATDLLSERLEAIGFEVTRQGFFYDGALAQNLSVQAVGRELANEIVLVVARYDSALGSPGADDNATGAAAALALAKRFYRSRPERTVRFVMLSDASGRASSAGQGAMLYARQMHEELGAQKIAAVVELNGLGVYSDTPGSQRSLPGMPQVRDVGDYVELTTYPEYAGVAGKLSDAMKAVCVVPVVTSLLLERAQLSPAAVHAPFVDYGYPALMLSDTHARRFAAFGTAADRVEALDFDRFARVTWALSQALLALSGPLAPEPIAAD